MSPNEYIRVREESLATSSKASNASKDYYQIVDNYPYYPQLYAIENNIESIQYITWKLMSYNNSNNKKTTTTIVSTTTVTTKVDDKPWTTLHVEKVSGGITNILYKVSGTIIIGSSSSFENNNDNDDSNSNNNNNTTTQSKNIQVLIRIFGGNGLINRDDENSTYAALAYANIAPIYYGRFGNGRIEQWWSCCSDSDSSKDTVRSLTIHELSDPIISKEIAISLATMHILFQIPYHLQSLHNIYKQSSTLWEQINNWYIQTQNLLNTVTNNIETNNDNNTEAAKISDKDILVQELIQSNIDFDNTPAPIAKTKTTSSTDNDDRVNVIKKPYNDSLSFINSITMLQNEIENLQSTINPNLTPLVFCHNDLLAANILYCNKNKNNNNNDSTDPTTNTNIQIIDYEYGNINYVSFDIANHFNEYAGGPPYSSIPDYTLLPTKIQIIQFCTIYLYTSQQLISEQKIKKHNKKQQEQKQSNKNHTTDTTSTITSVDNPNWNIIENMTVTELVNQVILFLSINHIYWGLWAINQAITEGTTKFNYIEYAYYRINQYWITKKKEINNNK